MASSKRLRTTPLKTLYPSPRIRVKGNLSGRQQAVLIFADRFQSPFRPRGSMYSKEGGAENGISSRVSIDVRIERWKGEGDHASRVFPYASLHATRCIFYIYISNIRNTNTKVSLFPSFPRSNANNVYSKRFVLILINFHSHPIHCYNFLFKFEILNR